ncbi:hypothetical protein KIN20_016936 [Parelaphostrongylus tenuis]|uniref:Uncharacterized protein n=1 Tax=Parelaphostrongylus tenuis TaxID=148309 RepID=A0AAD5QTG3_PARTN|nr:hypothetical protein KIN20_016936 [Parelaphostrongylus tenuis]
MERKYPMPTQQITAELADRFRRRRRQLLFVAVRGARQPKMAPSAKGYNLFGNRAFNSFILFFLKNVEYWLNEALFNLEDSIAVAFHRTLLLTAGEKCGVELGSTRAVANTATTRPRPPFPIFKR